MKKIFLIGIACALTIGLCACGTENTEQQPSSSPASTSSTQTAATESVKTGILLEASAHRLVIEAPDGDTYAFVTDDSTQIDGSSETLGDTISVRYDGEYSENMTAKQITIDQKADENVSSTAVEATDSDSKDDSKSTEESSEKSVTKSASKSSVVKYITGVVKDSSMNNITVEWGGNDYTILKDDNTTVEGNVTVGATVRVYHTGDLADGVMAIDISVVDENFADKDMKYITGTVVDASMNNIVIENGGHQYTVLKDDNTKSDSVQVGDTVRVYHKGGLADGMVASSIIKQ